jgi:hypothetical protein
VQIIVVLTSLFLVRMSAHMVLRDGHRRKLFDDECLPGQWEAPAESDLQNAGPIFSDAFLRGPFAARGESGAGRPTPERSLGRAARCPRWLSFGGGRSRGCGSQAERPNAPPTAVSRSDPAVGLRPTGSGTDGRRPPQRFVRCPTSTARSPSARSRRRWGPSFRSRNTATFSSTILAMCIVV